MDDGIYLYEFKFVGLNLLNTKQFVQVETDERVSNPKELLTEQGLESNDFLYIRLVKIVDNVYTVLYDIDVS